MKKVVIIIICIMAIIFFSTIGYLVVSANTEVEIEENIINIQNELQENFKSYGYTLDNPNIIINPYEISPLTALIIFETDSLEEVSIIVEGKTKETTYTNTFEKSKIHYIPIYGLYPDYTNKIIIKCKGIEKEIEIKTDKLPEDLEHSITNEENKLIFITSDNMPYAIDENNDIRWYLTKKYSGRITQMSNGHLLLSTDKKLQNNTYTGLIEIDYLGKIYKEYKIKTGYNGNCAETDNTLLVLSQDLLEIDKQTSMILNTIKLKEKYNTVEIKNNIITLTNDQETLQINKDTQKQLKIEENLTVERNITSLNLYPTNKNYRLETGISFDNIVKTKTSNKRIFLINYKKPDSNYNKYNIELKKETDRLVISGSFGKEDVVYIILDKFMDKLIYDVDIKENTTYKYINKEGLSGKYSIYIKINDTLYKTNQYVTF